MGVPVGKEDGQSLCDVTEVCEDGLKMLCTSAFEWWGCFVLL